MGSISYKLELRYKAIDEQLQTSIQYWVTWLGLGGVLDLYLIEKLEGP